MSVYVRQNINVTNNLSSKNSWIISNEIAAKIKAKIEAVGIPLAKWDIQINYGIKTGYNEAFIIDQAKRDELLRISPESDQIIRPILSGKNIKRYQFNWDNKWIIFTRKGIDIEKYPVIKAHLEAYYSSLRPRNNNESTGRKPGPYKWFEIQDNVAYYKDFEKQKIAWGNLALKGQFALVDAGYYINAPSSFIATDQVYLIAILNSKLADFYIKQLGVTRNGGYFEYKPMFVEQLPVPDISFDDQEKLLKLLNISKINNDQSIELQIDQFVYQMYGLTNDEIGYINNIKFRKIQ